MAHLIDKDALATEIDRLDALYHTSKSLSGDLFIQGLYCFLDTLEVKDVDLNYIKKELDELIKIHKPNGDFGWGILYNVATHFFELGLKAQKEK